MSRFEKGLCIVWAVYLPTLIAFEMGVLLFSEPAAWGQAIVTTHLIGMLLCGAVLITVLQDIWHRDFERPSRKIMWAALVLLFLGTAYYYLPKYGFKPRTRQGFCTACGYDLRGTLAADGDTCPECGEAIKAAVTT